MILEDLAKRLQTRREEELGTEKQKRPLEDDKRVEKSPELPGSTTERGRSKFLQAPTLKS